MPKPISHKAKSGGKSPAEPHGPPLSTRMVAGRPQRAKARRNSACTAVTGTCNQRPEGKNGRPQNGATALIDDPQPTHALAGAQANEFFGIDLPDCVGPTRPCRIAGRAAALRGGTQTRLVEPALQRPLGGQRCREGLPGQVNANETGAPGRVLLAEGERLIVKELICRAAWPVARGVGGGELRVGLLTPLV
jgi:hypothetical protein